MKHIIKVIENIVDELRRLPSEIMSDESLEKAKILLGDIQNQTTVLEKLVSSRKEDEVIAKLEETHIDRVEGWSELVRQKFSSIKALIVALREDVSQLIYITKNTNSEWDDAVDRMRLKLLETDLIKDQESLKELKKVELFDIKELEEIIKEEQELAKLI